jgi:hypothetical protein
VYRTQPCSCWPKPDSVVLGECPPRHKACVPNAALGRGPALVASKG